MKNSLADYDANSGNVIQSSPNKTIPAEQLLARLAGALDAAMVMIQAESMEILWCSDACRNVSSDLSLGQSIDPHELISESEDLNDLSALSRSSKKIDIKWREEQAVLSGIGENYLLLKIHHIEANQLSHYLSEREQLFLQSRTISVSEMATTLAHELNQPIGTISNMLAGMQARLQRDDNADEKFVKALAIAGEQTHFASQIISRIRDFTDSRQPQFVACDLDKLVRKSLSLLDWVFAAEQVSISYQPSPENIAVRGDSTMLQQVLTNLFRNAVDAMRERDATARVITVNTSLEDSNAKISIVDQGTGLKPETEKSLYTPFVTSKKSGMGVGLNICRSFVELHQGRLWLTNNDHEGCTAHILLPLSVRENV